MLQRLKGIWTIEFSRPGEILDGIEGDPGYNDSPIPENKTCPAIPIAVTW